MMMTDVVGDDDDNERRRSKWQRLAVAMAAVTGTATGLMNATMAPLTDEDDDWLAAAMMGDCGGDDCERRCRRRRPR